LDGAADEHRFEWIARYFDGIDRAGCGGVAITAAAEERSDEEDPGKQMAPWHRTS
jgi:hypothetical protein